jgi:hypothetical protein
MLRAVAATDHAALVAARPCRVIPGSLRQALGSGWLAAEEKQLLERAAEAVRTRSSGAPVRVVQHRNATDARRPPGAWHHGPPMPILDIR